MATKVAQKRLQKEYLAMQKSPPPFIWANPEEKNILDWHFIIRGPPDTPYEGGEYHGLIWFPSDYPFKPPDVKMFTPSGRFETGHKICMSMTSYHPSSWNAAWSVATILTGLLSFMLSDEITAGAVKTTDEQKKILAKQSHAFNIGNKKFREIFPTYATPQMTDLPDMGKTAPPPASSASKGLDKISEDGSSKAITKSSSDTTISTNSDIATKSTPPLMDTNTDTKPNDQTETIPPLPSSSSSKSAPNVVARNPNTHTIARPGHAHQPHAYGISNWLPSWRWVIAVVLLAVLGRLSSFVGL